MSAEMEIFRTGQWRSQQGIAKAWTEGDLQELARSYDPTLAPAPLTIGHTHELPTSAPAYGWVTALTVRGGRLIAQLGQVVPELNRLVRAGYYKTRSVEIYPPEHPANPVPGRYYLKAVAFLGAKAPAVKGLAEVQFSETPALSYAEPATTTAHKGGDAMTNFWQRLRTRLAAAGIATPPLAHDDGGLATEVAGTRVYELLNAFCARVSDLFADDTVDDKKTRVLALADELKTMIAALDFVERDRPARPATFSEADVQAAAERARQEERAKAEQATRTATRTAAIAAFCDGLKAKGHLLPAWEKAGLRTFLEQLATQEEAVAFAEGTDAKKITPLDWMTAFLAGLPQVVTFQEIAPADTRPKPTLSATQQAINRQLGVSDDLVLKFATNN